MATLGHKPASPSRPPVLAMWTMGTLLTPRMSGRLMPACSGNWTQKRRYTAVQMNHACPVNSLETAAMLPFRTSPPQNVLPLTHSIGVLPASGWATRHWLALRVSWMHAAQQVWRHTCERWSLWILRCLLASSAQRSTSWPCARSYGASHLSLRLAWLRQRRCISSCWALLALARRSYCVLSKGYSAVMWCTPPLPARRAMPLPASRCTRPSAHTPTTAVSPCVLRR
mmetsp:Transcript_56082/g.114191  ORF Transcript_56082/g.114191 Transcript_56082/m.114191 type:complete len:227 (+) Transcript_56082:4790-5470(+)